MQYTTVLLLTLAVPTLARADDWTFYDGPAEKTISQSHCTCPVSGHCTCPAGGCTCENCPTHNVLYDGDTEQTALLLRRRARIQQQAPAAAPTYFYAPQAPAYFYQQQPMFQPFGGRIFGGGVRRGGSC